MAPSSTAIEIKNIIKIAGAYIAWVIGSGFATGQEVLQFFSSYGYMSYAVVGITLIGFILFGYLLMRTGFENKSESGFDHFRYFCGKYLGTGYSCLISITLLFLIPVLISGGGATLNEYYKLPKPIGSALLAILVLVVYLIGFEKMVSIISKLGPVIIFFSLSVGIVSLFQSMENWAEIPVFESALEPYKAAPTWWLSGILYLGLNFFPGSTYFTQLGSSANSKKELKYGAICGGVILLLSIAIMSTAIMLNGDSAAGLDVPALYLARNISKFLGAVFSVMLVLGIFSSCSIMTWSVCSNFSAKTGKNTLTAIAVTVFGYVISLFSFGTLISTIYPLIGYAGLIFLGCVISKCFPKKAKQ